MKSSKYVLKANMKNGGIKKKTFSSIDSLEKFILLSLKDEIVGIPTVLKITDISLNYRDEYK
jgi:hypothetical protein